MNSRVGREMGLLALSSAPILISFYILSVDADWARRFIKVQLIGTSLSSWLTLGLAPTLSALALGSTLRPSRWILLLGALACPIAAAAMWITAHDDLTDAALIASLTVIAILYRLPALRVMGRAVLLAQFLILARDTGRLAVSTIIVTCLLHLAYTGAFRRGHADKVRPATLAHAYLVSVVKDFFYRGHYLLLSSFGLAGEHYASILRLLDISSRPTDYLFQRLVDEAQISSRLGQILRLVPLSAGSIGVAMLLLPSFAWMTWPMMLLTIVSASLIMLTKYLAYEQNANLRFMTMTLMYAISIIGALPLSLTLTAEKLPLVYFVGSLVILTVSLLTFRPGVTREGPQQVMARSSRMRRYLKDYVFKSPLLGRTLWNVMRHVEARRDRLAPIRDLHVAPPVAEAPQRILICTSIAGHPTAFRVDSLLAQALSRRGHDVTVLLCDGYLEACQDCEYRWIPSEPHFSRHGPARRNCGSCKLRTGRGLAGVRYLNYSDLDQNPSPAPDLGIDYKAWFALKEGEINLGEHVKAGALRFLAKGIIDPTSDFERKVVERYGKAAYKTLSVARTLASQNYDRIILHHGIYVPQGVLCDVLRRSCDSLYTWALGYRSSCILFARGDTYHKVFAGDMPGWDDYDLDDLEVAKLEDYLRSRGSGANDWVSWNRNSQGLESYPGAAEFFERYKDRCIGLFTNVFWDAQLHFEQSVFDNMLEWILATLRWFADRPDLGLVIRIHPAEVTGTVPSRQLLVDEIRARFPDLPPNVLVIPPQEGVNSYDIAAHCRGALIYGTKMGMELAALGKPVITAGDAWVRGKGITLDPPTREAYFAEIDRIASEEISFDRDRARKFAHFYFFKKMIEIKSLRKGSLFAAIELQESDRDDGLRLICDAVEQGLDVVN